ncbi:MAG: hypothetical protein ACRC9M_10400 [Aeromonas sp.]
MKLQAVVQNPTGHSITIESRGYPKIEIQSAAESTGPQFIYVNDEQDLQHIRDQIRLALPFVGDLITVDLVVTEPEPEPEPETVSAAEPEPAPVKVKKAKA